MEDLIYKTAKQYGLSPSEKELKVLISQQKKLLRSMDEIENIDLNNVTPILKFNVGDINV